MEKSILQTFFEKNLPLHQLLDDRLLSTLDEENLLKRNFRYVFSVDEMIRISYRMENFLISMPGHFDAHVSFQSWSRFTRQKVRYKSVAKAARKLWIYGAMDIEIPTLHHAKFIDTTATQLVDYWFIVLQGNGASGTLLAVEDSPLGDSSGMRLYRGFYSFDPMTATQITSVLHQYFPADVPNPLTGGDLPKAE